MRKRPAYFSSFAAVLLTALSVIPFLYVFAKSLLSAQNGFTLSYYYQVFLAQEQYLLRFWKSLGLCLCITAGQVVVSTLAGYGFAKCRFPGKNVLFFLLMVLMIMPLQVTLVPNYIMLDRLGLLDTYYALVLPMIFVPLGTFIMTQSFQAVPNEIIEAARLDGCGTLKLICRIAVPMNRAGLICTAAVLPGRLEYGGAAHGLSGGFRALPHFRSPGFGAAGEPHRTAGVLYSGRSAAPVPVRLF